MRLSLRNRMDLHKVIDPTYDPETSIVLRYRNAFRAETPEQRDSEYKEWLKETSIREGVRIFQLLIYKGVEVSILDETSLMHTRTLKSIDGCVTIARCKLNGYERVVFESGGNTGTALTEYGIRAGLETFMFIPEENLSLLNSNIFRSERAHLLSVGKPGLLKDAARLVGKLNGLKQIPEADWRYEASMFRGFFILEYLLERKKFDWLTQTISAAFGPIGIYRVLNHFSQEIGNLPRFLGIQQEVNSPMFKAWKSKETNGAGEMTSTGPLLSKVMYDANPQTYGSYEDLRNLLSATGGGLTTVNHQEFRGFMEEAYDGKNMLDLLK